MDPQQHQEENAKDARVAVGSFKFLLYSFAGIIYASGLCCSGVMLVSPPPGESAIGMFLMVFIPLNIAFIPAFIAMRSASRIMKRNLGG